MKKTVLLLLLLLLSITFGCKQAADLAKYKEQAVALAGKYGPQLLELGKKVPDLLARVKSLPPSVPGASTMTKLLEDNQGQLDKLRSMLDGLPQRVASGTPEEAKRTLDTTEQDLSSGVSTLAESVKATESTVGELEVQAKGASANVPPPPPEPAKSETVEEQLIAFLKDSSRNVDTTTWFNFDRLAFQEGKAELDAGKSAAQISSIAAILREHPNAKLKIGGYTDNTGSLDANKRISTQRAEAVVAALVAAGIEKERLAGEGYGPEHPVCPANDTDECKAKNRRIALRVTAK